MKSKMNIKSIIIMAIIGIVSLFFIHISFAANTGKISVETANIRETADEDAKILEQISLNDEVEILETTGEWYKVKAKGITGYLRQDLITINKENETKETIAQEPAQAEESNQNSKTVEQETQIVTENTKLKIVPVINATDIIEVKKDEKVSIIETVNGWVCVETQTTKGWIRKEKLKKEEEQPAPVEQTVVETQPVEPTVIKTLFVKGETVNVRKEANTTAEIIKTLPMNTAVDVIEEAEGWSKIKINENTGYILSSLLSSSKQEETSRSANIRKAETKEPETPQEVPVSGNGSAVVEYAKQFIGIKYLYGGTSPETGFDCSGFTSYVFKHFGVNLPRTTGGQANVGTAVDRNSLAPGDLIIYGNHVAIYVGGGQVIHSPRTGKTVCIVPLNQAASGYIGARRVI